MRMGHGSIMGQMSAFETSGDGAYRALRSDILFGRLAPGVRLRLEALSATYGASVSTLREILHRLASENLVITDQRGFDVAAVTSREFRDLGDLRELLETHALRAALTRGDLDWEGLVVGAHHKLARLEALMLAGDTRRSDEWKLYDREFHHALVSACGSVELRAAYHAIFDRYLRYLNVAVVFRGEIAAQEHRALRDAALDRDAPRVAALLHRHIDGCVTHSVTHDLLPEGEALPDRADPGGASARPRAPVTVGEAGWLRVRRDILDGHLVPGQKLRLDRMRADYGVSISTLREILSRLASEGIVLAEGQRGFEVAPVSSENLAELVDLYRLLADRAIGRALDRGDLDWETRLVAACHPLGAHEAALNAGDNEAMNQWRQGQSLLFQVLVDACGSVALRHLHGTILDKLLRYCCLARGRSAAAITAIDHHSLRDAALRRDAGQARQLLADHLTRLSAQIGACGLLEN